MRFKIPRISDARDHILTGLILLLSIALMVSKHRGGLDVLRSFSISMVSYLEEPLANIRIYRKALKTNADLRRQNVLLLDELSRHRSAAEENARLRSLLDFKSSTNINLQAVQVVSKELTGIHNLLTIDAGQSQKVKQGMPMVTDKGLVGKVVLTAANYAQVMPYASSLFRVSAQIQHNNVYGIISWEGSSFNELVMDYVPQTFEADSGLTVETSGFSNEYPPHIPIGTINRVEKQTGQSTQRIYLKPNVTLHDLTEGFVIKFQPDSSTVKLNKQYKNLFK